MIAANAMLMRDGGFTMGKAHTGRMFDFLPAL